MNYHIGKGLPSRYSYVRGCRCEDCTRSSREYQRKYRAGTQPPRCVGIVDMREDRKPWRKRDVEELYDCTFTKSELDRSRA